MTDNTTGGRVDRLEGTVASLGTGVATLTADVQGIKEGQALTLRALDNLNTKLENSRTNISHIWAPMAVAVAMMSAAATGLASPQLARVSNLETAQHEGEKAIVDLRIEAAITKALREAHK